MSLNSNPTNLCKLFSKCLLINFLLNNMNTICFPFPANQNIISNSDLLTSLPQSSTNGTNRNLLDLNFDTLDNTGNTLKIFII